MENLLHTLSTYPWTSFLLFLGTVTILEAVLVFIVDVLRSFTGKYPPARCCSCWEEDVEVGETEDEDDGAVG